jgi:hypothetical protein
VVVVVVRVLLLGLAMELRVYRHLLQDRQFFVQVAVERELELKADFILVARVAVAVVLEPMK